MQSRRPGYVRRRRGDAGDRPRPDRAGVRPLSGRPKEDPPNLWIWRKMLTGHSSPVMKRMGRFEEQEEPRSRAKPPALPGNPPERRATSTSESTGEPQCELHRQNEHERAW